LDGSCLTWTCGCERLGCGKGALVLVGVLNKFFRSLGWLRTGSDGNCPGRVISGEFIGDGRVGASSGSCDGCFGFEVAVRRRRASIGALMNEKNPLSCSLLGFGSGRSVGCNCNLELAMRHDVKVTVSSPRRYFQSRLAYAFQDDSVGSSWRLCESRE